ncbi:MAG: DUF975 family protein [Oscillospiraceae bacterium]|jgi:uncharacterized membrane protein|nr:DUF975 family protein [Oscillospiraceae bacterium]
MPERAELKRMARESMRGKKPPVLLVSAVNFIIIFVISFIMLKLLGTDKITAAATQYIQDGNTAAYTDAVLAAQPTAVPMLLTVVLSLFIAIIGVGFMSYCLKVSRGRETSVRDLGDGFTFFFKFIWLSIVTGFFIFLWSLLFVIPGVVAACRYSQAVFIMLDNPELSALECIRASKERMRGHKLEYFVLELSFLGWLIVSSAIAYVIGLFTNGVGISLLNIWLMPYMYITFAFYYRRLAGDAQAGAIDAAL